MDTQRSSLERDDDASAEAPGIETPALIGQDERRMHVRAYNFWAKLLEGHSFPSIELLDLDTLGDFGSNSVLLDFTAGIENPAIAYLGEALARECDIDDGIHYINDVPRRSLLSRLTDHYLQIIANRAPIGFEAEFVNARGATILYRGVLLPFSTDDDTIDFIMGVINWKQAAEPALADAIAGELADSPPAAPPSRPVLPVWSDTLDAGSGLDDDEADFDADDAGIAAAEQVIAPPPLQAPVAANDVIMDADRAGSGDGDGDGDNDVLELDATFALPVDGSDQFAAAALFAAEPDDPLPIAPIDPDAMGLADWLASARDCADSAAQANARGHAALYEAIGRACGFARAAAAAPEDYAELLEEAGITASPRAPMTAVVKLVFGIAHDKTRLAEYSAVLVHAEREAIDPLALPAYLARYDGGLKGLVRDIRSGNRGAAPALQPDAGTALRAMPALARIDWDGAPAGDYVLLLARREGDGSLALIAAAGQSDATTARFMKHAARRSTKQ